MTTIGYVSTSLSALCILLSLVVFFCALTDYDKRSKINRIFRIVVLFNIGITVSDVAAYLIEGQTGQYAFYIVRAANFLHYAFGALLLGAMSFYILTYLGTKIRVPRLLKDIIVSISALAILMTIASQFSGLYYYIDENNVYHRGNVFWLSQILPMAGMLFNMGVVLFYRKSFEKKFMFFFLAYMILPMAALTLALFIYGITFINIATSLSVFVLYIGVQIDHTHNIVVKLKLLDNQLELQGMHYKLLQSHIDEVRKARHDLRHHLSAIQAFIDTGESDRLAEYIDEYKATLPDDSVITFCDNYAINSVLQYYIGMAKNEGIKVNVHVELPEKLSIRDSDLCIIFGNCVENALEACRRFEGDRFINVKSMIVGNMLTIVIDNSFDGDLKKKGDGYISRKDGSLGIGVSSVKTVIRKHNGEARFEAKNNVFHASMMLNIKPL